MIRPRPDERCRGLTFGLSEREMECLVECWTGWVQAASLGLCDKLSCRDLNNKSSNTNQLKGIQRKDVCEASSSSYGNMEGQRIRIG
jgi:hypothetical protein